MAHATISVDALAEKFPGRSTYGYVLNNPLKYIDPTGMEGESHDGGGIGGWFKKAANWISNEFKKLTGEPKNEKKENDGEDIGMHVEGEELTIEYNRRSKEAISCNPLNKGKGIFRSNSFNIDWSYWDRQSGVCANRWRNDFGFYRRYNR